MVSFSVPSRLAGVIVLSRKWRLTPMFTQTHPRMGSAGHDVDPSGAGMILAKAGRLALRATITWTTVPPQFGSAGSHAGGGGKITEHGASQRPPVTVRVFGFAARATLPAKTVSGSGF